MRQRQIVFLIVSALVSALFLWLALRDVDLQAVIDSIRQANIAWVLMALLSGTGALTTRAIRWRGLLGFRLSLWRAFHIINITFLLNQLPLRAGEVARSLLAARYGVPVMTAATSIVVERILDTLLVVVLLAAGLSQLPDAPPSATSAAALFGIGAVIAFIVMLFFAHYPAYAHNILKRLEGLVPFIKRLNLSRLLDNVLDGLQPLTTMGGLVFAVGWTLIAWSFSLVSLYTLLRALDITGVNLLLADILGVTLASFSIAIPVSVASIRPFEAALQVAGTAVGIPLETATSLGFLFHGVGLVVYAVWGTIGLMALGVSLSEVVGQHNDSDN